MAFFVSCKKLGSRLLAGLCSLFVCVVGVLCIPLRDEIAERIGLSLSVHQHAAAPTTPPPAPPTPVSVRQPPEPARLLIDGIWVPSGWMGDAEEGEAGPLRFRVVRDGETGLPCEEWSYTPRDGGVGWVAASYQFPEANWGSQPGKDLSRFGFTRVTFLARGKMGGECVVFKSGGHTAPGVAFPSSYQVSSGSIVLTREWARYSIALPPGTDLINTVSAFAFVVTHWSGPQTFYLRQLQFEGPSS